MLFGNNHRTKLSKILILYYLVTMITRNDRNPYNINPYNILFGNNDYTK